MLGIGSMADRTTLDTLVPDPRKATANGSLSFLHPPVATSPTADASALVDDAPRLEIGCRAALTTVKRKPKSNEDSPTISPSVEPIPMSHLVDLTESTLTPTGSPSKRQEMVEYRRNSEGCTLADVAKVGEYSTWQSEEWVARDKREGGLMNRFSGRKEKWVVSKAAVEITNVLPDFHSTNPKVNKVVNAASIPAVTFKHTRAEVMKTTVVDYWFKGDARGERELIKCVTEALKTIKIGMDMVNLEEVIGELGAAVDRGVDVQLLIDLKKACNEGLGWVKELLEAGVKVCHSTVKLEWKAAMFDGQILVQGSQSWTKTHLHDFNMGYTMVHTGPIASAFEDQFDKMWKTATKEVTKGSKRAKTGADTGHREGNESYYSEESSSDMEPGKKRRHGKRTCFPTTLAFLEMLGF